MPQNIYILSLALSKTLFVCFKSSNSGSLPCSACHPLVAASSRTSRLSQLKTVSTPPPRAFHLVSWHRMWCCIPKQWLWSIFNVISCGKNILALVLDDWPRIIKHVHYINAEIHAISWLEVIFQEPLIQHQLVFTTKKYLDKGIYQYGQKFQK